VWVRDLTSLFACGKIITLIDYRYYGYKTFSPARVHLLGGSRYDTQPRSDCGHTHLTLLGGKVKNTLSILWVLVEVAALARSAIATFLVVQAVTNDFLFSLFTVAVIEGVFLTSLFLMKQEAVAPISAILALAFSAVMQYFELRVLDGSITPQEKDILRYAVAFAPIVILGLSYIRRLVVGDDSPLSSLVEKMKQDQIKARGLKQGA
jgi:hypothetical protein